MNVSHRFIVKQLPSHPSLELLTVTLHYGNCYSREFLSLYYHPPSSSVEVLYCLHSILESINIPQFSSFVLIGDFSTNFFDVTHSSFL